MSDWIRKINPVKEVCKFLTPEEVARFSQVSKEYYAQLSKSEIWWPLF